MPGTVPAVNSPAPLMVPPPATTDQLGDNQAMRLPYASRPSARNCRVVVAGMVSGPAGETVMVARRGEGRGVTVTDALPETLPSVAVTVLGKVPTVEPAVNMP